MSAVGRRGGLFRRGWGRLRAKAEVDRSAALRKNDRLVFAGNPYARRTDVHGIARLEHARLRAQLFAVYICSVRAGEVDDANRVLAVAFEYAVVARELFVGYVDVV